jgi:hypothetical protein
MTERFEEHALASCFAAHRTLFEAAAVLSRRLSTTTDDGYLMHLGASCMRIAAHCALQSHDSRETLRRWRECMLAERQIRLATYGALRSGGIDNATYDEIFGMARQAARIRENERQRLRRELQRLVIV